MGRISTIFGVNVILITVFMVFMATCPSFGKSFSEEIKETHNLIYSGKFSEGLALAKDIFSRAEAAGDSSSAASALLYVSDGHYYLGQRDLTLPPLQHALQIYEALNDNEGIGRSYYSISYYYERTDPSRMIEILQTAGLYAAKAEDDKLEMNIANATGVALWGVGKYDEAIVALEESIAFARKNNWEASMAACFQNIALIHLNQGRPNESLANSTRAMAIFKKEGATHSYAVGLGNSGNAYLGLREFEKGLECYEEALAIHRENSYLRGEAINLNCIAGVYLNLQEWDQAHAYLLQAAAINEEMENNRDLLLTLSLLGDLALGQGKTTDAKDYYVKAVVIGERLGDPFLLDGVEKALAEIAMYEGNVELARQWLNKAENHARQAGKPQTMGNILALRSKLAAKDENWTLAAKFIGEAIGLHEQIRKRNRTYQWHALWANYLTMAGNLDGARKHFDTSLELINNLDAMIATDRFRVGFFREVAQIYHQYAVWLAGRGEIIEGMALLDQGRSRVLALRLLQNSGRDIFSPEQQDALNRISVLQLRLRQEVENGEENEEILKLLAAAEWDYEKASGAENVAGTPDTTAELAELDQSTLHISYSAQNDTLAVFSLAHGKASFRTIPHAEETLTRARMYADLMANPSSGERSRVAGKSLGQLLMGPELAGFKGDRILINPDSDLWTFPFVALITQQDRYLGEQVSLGLAPSWNVLQSLSHHLPPTGNRALVLANSNFGGSQQLEKLSSAKSEANNVASHFHEATILFDASESDFKNLSLDQFNVLHFATHTLTDVNHPLRSSIVLGISEGEDGLLQAREIHHLPLDCNLVVVSGCKSGSGKVVLGEGLLGVTHSLLRAGAHCVVMSRWDITDAGAARFMDEFYQALEGHAVAEAVAIAQQKLRESEQWSHPYYWAPYFVAGDGSVVLDNCARGGNSPLKAILGFAVVLGLFALFIAAVRKKH